MKYNELKLHKQTKTSRPGRGISAGRGKTAGRGTKGQGSRKSGGVRPGFEGGQMPLYMKLPKLRGFKSHRQPTETVSTGQLELLKKSIVNPDVLANAGLISNSRASVKVIFKGEISSKKDVTLQSASKSAELAINKAGGSFSKSEQRAGRPKKLKKHQKYSLLY